MPTPISRDLVHIKNNMPNYSPNQNHKDIVKRLLGSSGENTCRPMWEEIILKFPAVTWADLVWHSGTRITFLGAVLLLSRLAKSGWGPRIGYFSGGLLVTQLVLYMAIVLKVQITCFSSAYTQGRCVWSFWAGVMNITDVVLGLKRWRLLLLGLRGARVGKLAFNVTIYIVCGIREIGGF